MIETAQLVGDDQGHVHAALPRHPGGRVVRGDRVDDLRRRAERLEGRGGLGAVTGEVGLGLLAVEIVSEASEAPRLGVLFEARGKGTHDGLGGEHVAA